MNDHNGDGTSAALPRLSKFLTSQLVLADLYYTHRHNYMYPSQKQSKRTNLRVGRVKYVISAHDPAPDSGSDN